MERKAIVLNNKDNVATALADLAQGDTVGLEVDKKPISVKLLNPIQFGHKFSLVDIKSGSPILKYGEVIGEATKDIKAGEHVHVHNVASTRGRGDVAKGATR
ncbi:MAG TPA: D-galactarate dehydratase [Dehalococcoidia bacterium]|nr:D-galactarate dehydratase [Dehalococcoidia bacterium]